MLINIRTWDNSKEYLKELKERRKELIDQYGNHGEKHPTARMIGGLNSAARELGIVRGEISRIERETKKAKPEVKLSPLHNDINEKSKRLPMGLLFDMHLFGISSTVKARLGKDNLGKFYVVIPTDADSIIINNLRTIGDAKKALLNHCK